MRVLVVEDDQVIQQMIVDVLTNEGYVCSIADDGQKGVEVARSENPHVVLMDLMMPVMNGLDAIRELRRDPDTQRCRIIAMSAGHNLVEARHELEVDGILAKPFDIDVLIADVAIHGKQAAHVR